MKGRALRRIAVKALATIVVPYVFVFAIYFSWFERSNPVPTGDEPHYMLEAFSLVRDGDRDLANNYKDNNLHNLVYNNNPFPLTPQAFDYKGDGRLVSSHSPGLPALLAPAAAIGGSERWMRLELVALGALAAVLLLSVLAEVAGARSIAVYLIWAAVVFSLPFVGYASAIYPDMPAAVFVLVGVRAILTRGLAWPMLLAGSLAAAVLPWFHVRYTVLAVAIAGGLGAKWFVSDRRRLLARRTGPRLTRCYWALAPTLLVVSLAAMALAFQRWYGSPLLNAQFRLPAAGGGLHYNGASLYQNIFGELLGSRQGWLALAPVAVLALAGIGVLCVRYRWTALLACLAAGAYVAQTGTTGIGASLPARYLVPIMPLSAIALLCTVSAVRVTWVAFVPLAALTWGVTGDAAGRYAELIPSPSYLVTTPLAIKTQSLWPSFVPKGPHDFYPDATFTVAWVAGLAFLGLLFVQIAHLQQRRDGPSPAT